MTNIKLAKARGLYIGVPLLQEDQIYNVIKMTEINKYLHWLQDVCILDTENITYVGHKVLGHVYCLAM